MRPWSALCCRSAELVLLTGLVTGLAGCASAHDPDSSRSRLPDLSGYWSGTLILHLPGMGPEPSGQYNLHLQQGSNGSITGTSTDCGGEFGSHVIHSAISGSVSAASHVTLNLNDHGYQDPSYFQMSGVYAQGAMMLSGPPSADPNHTQNLEDTTLTLERITQAAFAGACAGQ